MEKQLEKDTLPKKSVLSAQINLEKLDRIIREYIPSGFDINGKEVPADFLDEIKAKILKFKITKEIIEENENEEKS